MLSKLSTCILCQDVEGVKRNLPSKGEIICGERILDLHRAVYSTDDIFHIVLNAMPASRSDYHTHDCSSILHSVALYSFERLQAVLQKGVKVDEPDCRGYTALSLTAERGLLEESKLLLDYISDSDANNVTKAGDSVLHLATKKMNKYKCKDDTQIFEAPQEKKQRHIELVELLLSKGANVNALDALGRTPIVISAYEGTWWVANVLKKHGGSIWNE